MKNVHNPKIDVDELLAQLREEIARHRGDATGRLASEYSTAARWRRITAGLNIGQQHAQIGANPPSFLRFRAPKRFLARVVARIILYLSQVATVPQRHFNVSVLQTLQAIAEALTELEEGAVQLKRELVLHRLSLDTLLGHAIRPPYEAQDLGSRQTADENRHRLDALYASFEDHFRGSRTEIINRVSVYVPLLRKAGIGSEEMPILDLGCGRGEWLEVLREEGLRAHGVENNRLFVIENQERGLEVTESDLFTYLVGVRSASIGAVTSFHVIEHLSFAKLIMLLDEIVRVLKPAGLALLETPNPENILVGSHLFYLDPTHRRPVPSLTMKFLAEARGLSRVEVIQLHPSLDGLTGDDSELVRRFNQYFYGPQDYALVGWKV